ncbi:DUF2255 family protein [Roseibium sp. SCPC15]|uniref:DUF2255 family protein n=1 Tax=Roseibium sp. SCP15 TaxID=3141376 RepID=UPI003335A58F
MAFSSLLNLAVDLPRLLVGQAIQPLRLAFRSTETRPTAQGELAELVNRTLQHKIRAGYTHRFIPLLFVTVGDRVFCRRYSYGEPSWHSAFRADPRGQVQLDKTLVYIKATVPADLDNINPDIDRAYAAKLKQLGARFLLEGAIDPRARESTMELTLASGSATQF